MGNVINFETGLSPIEGLTMREYRRLSNILLMQYNATEFKVKAIGRIGRRVAIEVQMTNPYENTVIRL